MKSAHTVQKTSRTPTQPSSLTAPRLRIAAACIATAGASASAQSTLYPNRAAFDAAVPQRSLETFNNARAIGTNFTGPLDRTSNVVGGNGQAVFTPGDIVPGIRFDDTFRESFGDTFNLRADTAGGSTILRTSSAGNSLIATFTATEQIKNFALDAYQFNAPGPVTINVFGASGLLHSSQGGIL